MAQPAFDPALPHLRSLGQDYEFAVDLYHDFPDRNYLPAELTALVNNFALYFENDQQYKADLTHLLEFNAPPWDTYRVCEWGVDWARYLMKREIAQMTPKYHYGRRLYDTSHGRLGVQRADVHTCADECRELQQKCFDYEPDVEYRDASIDWYVRSMALYALFTARVKGIVDEHMLGIAPYYPAGWYNREASVNQLD